MPLSGVRDRQKIHNRTIECQGYRRNDGLYDVEGRLVDTKDYDFPNQFRGEIKKGEAIHDMRLRLTIDENLVIHDVEAAMDAVPYAICPQITPAFKALIGLTIGPGWSRATRRTLGGIKGCTHLSELLGPLATVAFQTIIPGRQRQREERGGKSSDYDKGEEDRPPQINSCHAYASDGQVVKTHWPRFFTNAAPGQDEAPEKGK